MTVDIGDVAKVCRVCKRWHRIECFYSAKSNKDGRSNRCKECTIAYVREWVIANPRKEYLKAWRAKNVDLIRERDKRVYAENSDFVKSRMRQWRKENPDKVKAGAPRRNARTARWRKANPDKIKSWQKRNAADINFITAKRRAQKKNATPFWANMHEVRSYYRLAVTLTRLTGIAHNVDHIVPLQSDFVCGLHNQFNLQVLIDKENFRKGNRRWPDMP